MSKQEKTRPEGKVRNISQLSYFRKSFFLEVILFSLVLVLGIINANRFLNILPQTAQPSIREAGLPQVHIWEFILYFTIGTLFIVAMSTLKRFEKSRGIVFKVIFVLAVGIGSFVSLNLWIPDIWALSGAVALILLWFKKPTILLHDLMIVLGIAGMGSVLGVQLSPLTVAVLLVFFSIYDFIAVYKTKHMVKMAKEMVKSRAILGLVVPSKAKDFSAKMGEVQPGGEFLIIGGGDITFPLLLCASLVSRGIFDAFVVAFFALIGMLVSFYIFISQKERRPIPALPPIALFSIVGFLVTLIF